jgi:hypothetical protein
MINQYSPFVSGPETAAKGKFNNMIPIIKTEEPFQIQIIVNPTNSFKNYH